ncbi:hypothetical protein [Rhodococcus aetherivorans]|uniref:hypothetical protein n=1 Tax=Rhodococcus aetherivorans TaxID=191292 RepID=UPI003890A3AA
MTQKNVVDLVADRVLEHIGEQVRDRIDDAVAAAATPAPVKADARDRATRTLIQGGIATAVVAMLVTFGQILSQGTVDVTSFEAWKLVAGTVLGAGITAAASYLQRLIFPPGGRE